MPATTAKSTKASTTKASTTKAQTTKAQTTKASTTKAKDGRAAKVKSAAAKTVDLSADVFTSVEAGQRTALAAVRRFVDTVDEALPALGAHPSRRETVIDAALDMADKLVTTQYDFLRHVVRSADRSLRLSDSKEK
jgi:hypothetical protein